MPIHRNSTTQYDEDADMFISEPVRKVRKLNKAGLLVLFLLLMLFLGSTAYYYRRNLKFSSNPQQASAESVQELVKKVSQLILLPKDETPTVATVTDPEFLKKKQSFFNNASVGDKILIYPMARKAFMYNPTLNKIIESAPIVFGNQQSAQTPADETTQPQTSPSTTTPAKTP